MQHAEIIAGIPTCRNVCNYCSVLHAIIVHKTTTLVYCITCVYRRTCEQQRSAVDGIVDVT